MKRLFFLLGFLIVFGSASYAQFDDKLAPLAKHTVRIALGNIPANNFNIQYRSSQGIVIGNGRSLDFTYERSLGARTSLALNYQHINYDISRYQLVRHSNSLNFYFTPLRSGRLCQLKFGSGVSYNRSMERIADDYFTNLERYSTHDLGLNCSAHLDFFIAHGVLLGIHYYREFNYQNSNFNGLRAQVTYSF